MTATQRRRRPWLGTGWLACLLWQCSTDQEPAPKASLVRFVDQIPESVGTAEEPVLVPATGPVLASFDLSSGIPRGWAWTLAESNETRTEGDIPWSEQGELRGVVPLDVCHDVEIRILDDGTLSPETSVWVAEVENPGLSAASLGNHVLMGRVDVVAERVTSDPASLRIPLRTSLRTQALVIGVRGGSGGEASSISVGEYQGDGRVMLTRRAMAAVRTPVGASPVAGRTRVGHSFAEVLFAPAPSTLEFAVEGSMSGSAVLSFGFGVLRDDTGRGDGDVTFRIRCRGDGQDGVVFEEVLEGAREQRHEGPHYRRVALEIPSDGGSLVFETSANSAEGDVLQAAWCHPTLRTAPLPESPRGLIMVSLDTLRADHVGAYGGDPGLTPNLDRFSEQCVIFDRAMAHVSYTLPSHASMFSGQYPSIHGMLKPGYFRDPAVTRWLAEFARADGLRTAAFTGGAHLAATVGIEGGFEAFHVSDAMLRGDFDQISGWLDSVSGEPFFLFLHTYAAHHYQPPDECLDAVHPPCESELHGTDVRGLFLGRAVELNEADRVHLQGVYDGCVYFADRQFGHVLELLEERQLLEQLPLLLVSDHGEELYDHGSVGHGVTIPFQEVIHVPLMYRPAGGATSRRVPAVVELIDVQPTVMELLGLPILEGIYGESLVGLLNGDLRSSGVAFAESSSGRHHALQGATWKAIRIDDGILVFDLEQDPFEQSPVDESSELYRQRATELSRTIDSVERRRAKLSRQVEQGELGIETLRELEQTGYATEER